MSLLCKLLRSAVHPRPIWSGGAVRRLVLSREDKEKCTLSAGPKEVVQQEVHLDLGVGEKAARVFSGQSTVRDELQSALAEWTASQISKGLSTASNAVILQVEDNQVALVEKLGKLELRRGGSHLIIPPFHKVVSVYTLDKKASPVLYSLWTKDKGHVTLGGNIIFQVIDPLALAYIGDYDVVDIAESVLRNVVEKMSALELYANENAVRQNVKDAFAGDAYLRSIGMKMEFAISEIGFSSSLKQILAFEVAGELYSECSTLMTEARTEYEKRGSLVDVLTQFQATLDKKKYLQIETRILPYTVNGNLVILDDKAAAEAGFKHHAAVVIVPASFDDVLLQATNFSFAVVGIPIFLIIREIEYINIPLPTMCGQGLVVFLFGVK